MLFEAMFKVDNYKLELEKSCYLYSNDLALK